MGKGEKVGWEEKEGGMGSQEMEGWDDTGLGGSGDWGCHEEGVRCKEGVVWRGGRKEWGVVRRKERVG